MFEFDLVPGPVVHEVLAGNRPAVLDLVRRTYLDHEAAKTVNPVSYFLRFPDKPDARIIPLPSFLDSDVPLAGIKWISSFPSNTETSLPRASALLILNDYETVYPIACLEAAQISAAVAADALRPGGYHRTGVVAVIGAGIIARNVCEYLKEAGCTPDAYVVHDLHAESGHALAGHLNDELGEKASFTTDLDTALEVDTVVFTTTVLRRGVPEWCG